MKKSLIGSTGFIGKNISKQFEINENYNTSNIDTFREIEHDLVFCAAPAAEKWIANKNPIEDLEKISYLLNCLKKTKVKKFILFSTIDVYGNNFGNDEDYKITLPSLHAYGRNRYILESYVSDFFDSHIIRLPALFGTGLKKNVIYDLLNNNLVNNISLQTEFQWFDLKKLNSIIKLVLEKEIKLINCVTEPVSTYELVSKYFPEKLNICEGNSNIKYNVLTKYSSSGYLFSKDQVIISLGDFLNDINK